MHPRASCNKRPHLSDWSTCTSRHRETGTPVVLHGARSHTRHHNLIIANQSCRNAVGLPWWMARSQTPHGTPNTTQPCYTNWNCWGSAMVDDTKPNTTQDPQDHTTMLHKRHTNMLPQYAPACCRQGPSICDTVLSWPSTTVRGFQTACPVNP